MKGKEIAEEYVADAKEDAEKYGGRPYNHEILAKAYLDLLKEMERKVLVPVTTKQVPADFSVDKAIQGITEYISLKAHNLALVGALEKWRDFIAEQPIGVFGIGSNGELDWPIRDEVIDSITKVLSNPDIQKYKRLLDAVGNCIKQSSTRGTRFSPWFELEKAYQDLQEKKDE